MIPVFLSTGMIRIPLDKRELCDMLQIVSQWHNLKGLMMRDSDRGQQVAKQREQQDDKREYCCECRRYHLPPTWEPRKPCVARR